MAWRFRWKEVCRLLATAALALASVQAQANSDPLKNVVPDGGIGVGVATRGEGSPYRGAGTRYDFVRGSSTLLLPHILEKLEELEKKQSTPQASERSVLLDTHLKDQLYALELGAPASSVGVLGGLLFLFPLLLSWPIGALADRTGARGILLFASCCGAASLVVSSMSDWRTVALLSRM